MAGGPDGARSRTWLAGRALALLGGVGVVAGWLFLWIYRPWGDLGVATPSALLVTAIFVGLGLAGLGAAVKDTPVVVAMAGLFGLFPVGIYFLVAPGFLPVVGWSDVALVVGGVAMVVGERRSRPADEPRLRGPEPPGA